MGCFEETLSKQRTGNALALSNGRGQNRPPWPKHAGSSVGKG